MSSHFGPNVQLSVEEELRPELDLVPTLLLLKMVLTVLGNPQRLGLVTTKSAQVSFLIEKSSTSNSPFKMVTSA